MWKRVGSVALLGVLALAGGLWLSSGPDPGSAEPAPAAPQSTNELFAEMARNVPGFGGMFFEGDTLKIVLKNPTAERTAVAEETVKDYLEIQRRSVPEKIEILAAQYDFAQLNHWYDLLNGAISVVPGVVLTDIDEVANRLYVGVDTPEAQKLIEQLVAQLAIPREAVYIEIVGAYTPASSLLNRHRPLKGGLRIGRSGGGDCTLGFNGTRQGTAGFVTASHCSISQGVVDGTGFYQPTVVDGNLVGVETVDPPFCQPGVNCPPACPAGSQCRYSDTDFVSLAGGVSSSRGYLAKTAEGSVTWNGAVYRITSDIVTPFVGEFVKKVGITTGTSTGFITRTCIAVGIGGGRWLLCQQEANFAWGGGDSGSPVFRVTNSPFGDDVTLYGSFHGGNVGVAFFSMVAEIERSSELGLIGTCASGFNC